MRSSDLCRFIAGLLALVAVRPALAQTTPAQGFAVERFSPSPAGAGWLVMDDLDLHGGLGGAVALVGGYARDPLDLSNPVGTQRLAVVSDQAFADVALSLQWDRFRWSLDLAGPLAIGGHSGTLDGYAFTAPAVNLGSSPDTLSDARVGFDVRLLGAHDAPLRLGASAQLFIPFGSRADDDTDGTFRALFKLLAAGDLGALTYAAQVGIHVRPLDDAPIPGSPEGSELLFGAAVGPKVDVNPRWRLVVGPEVYGETALRAFFGGQATGVEGLISGRLEGTGQGPQLRFKLGGGGGLDPNFGAPAWRVVAAVELFTAPSP